MNIFQTRYLRAFLKVVLLFLTTASTASAEVRTWTDSKGRKIAAEFLRIDGSGQHMKVSVRRADGTGFSFPVSQLSAADQAYIRDLLSASSPPPQPDAPAPAWPLVSLQVTAFVKEYCVACHNEEKERGDVRLDHLNDHIANAATAQVWQDILDVINAGEMPPEEAKKRPGDSQLAQMIGVLTDDLAVAQKRLRNTSGGTVSRRMNKTEFINGVRVLTGIEIPRHLVPDDENGDDFNTLGWYQTFSPSTLDAYQEAATYAIRRALFEGDQPVQDRKTIRIDDPKSKILRKGSQDQKKDVWKQVIKHYTSNPNHKTGVLIYKGENKWSPYQHRIADHDFRGEYIVRARIGVDESMEPELRFLRLTQEGDEPVFFYLTGTVKTPQIIEFRTRTGLGNKIDFAHLGRGDLRPATTRRIKRGQPVPTIWIDWIETEGPIYSGEFVRTRRDLLQGAKEKSLSEPDVHRILTHFATKAFRGMLVHSEFIDDLLVVYDHESESGKTLLDALVRPLAIILTAPQFLYLENKPVKVDEEGAGQLTGHALASRLSFMLWKEPPSNSLLAAGDRLVNERTFLESTIDEMVADSRFDRFVDEFFGQWLALHRLDQIVLHKSFVDFDRSKRQAARRQPLEFIRHLIDEDLSLENLIDSDFSVINPVLGSYYGDLQSFQEAFTDTGFFRVDLDAQNRYRGGLLGMPAIHLMGASGEETSPVERGVWIVRKLLNDPPAPPPPNVPQLSVAPKLTARESLERHKQVPQCFSCHQKFDDLGFALEHFDALGRWRETYPNQLPIKTSGRMPDGSRFENQAGMREALLPHTDKMVESIVESLIAYSLSRESSFSDQEFIARMVHHSRQSGFRVKPLLKAFVTSNTFTGKPTSP